MPRWLPLFLLSQLAGCALLADVLQAAFERPTLTFQEVALTDLDLESVTLATVWRVDNPNGVGLALARADYRLSVEGRQVVAGAPPLGLTIPASGSARLQFPATVRFADLAPLTQALTRSEVLHYRVEGTVGLDTPVGVVDFPLSYDGELERPRLPTVALQPPRVTRLGYGATAVELSAEFPIAVTNPNGFPLPLQGLQGQLSVAGQKVGTVSTADLGTLEAHGTRVVKVPLDFDLRGAADAVGAVLQGREAEVRLHARLKSGQRAIPIDVAQALRFAR